LSSSHTARKYWTCCISNGYRLPSATYEKAGTPLQIIQNVGGKRW
jgi:hypothetical protein